MEDSAKGILITITLAMLFITCIVNFLIMFPREQGITFTDTTSGNAYLQMQGLDSYDETQTSLTSLNSKLSNGTDNWDITVGFMGSNAIKQGSTDIVGSSSNVFKNLRVMAIQVFGANSPIIYVLYVISLLAIGFLIYAIIKFVRSGN